MADAPPLRLDLPRGLTRRGPLVIGATGGSGTRVVAAIARRAGVFLGTRLNESNDALDLAEYLDRWIGAYRLRHGADPLARAELLRAMATDLAAVLRRHCAALPDGAPWGWKEPRSMFVLPFLARLFPELRFVHVVRDGRDMAFSPNQNQRRKHAEVVLGPPRPAEPPEARSIALWATVNREAADFGEERLRERYLRIRFEELCEEPERQVRRLLDFLGLDADAAALADEPAAPQSIGRWRHRDPALVAELEREAGPALERFGYAVLAPAAGGP